MRIPEELSVNTHTCQDLKGKDGCETKRPFYDRSLLRIDSTAKLCYIMIVSVSALLRK